MKLTTTVLVSLTSLFSLASASCYGSGDGWPNKEQARGFVYDACHKNGGMFTGFYQAHQLKSMCPQSGRLGLLFIVENLNRESGFDLGDGDCEKELNRLIFECDLGGDSVVAGWHFRWGASTASTSTVEQGVQRMLGARRGKLDWCARAEDARWKGMVAMRVLQNRHFRCEKLRSFFSRALGLKIITSLLFLCSSGAGS
ncbi:hypothetical protein MBM_09163 [Drepanopeziza brunnea f. sp. 'multigermtubi' MB_m1]|uniref:Secreted protein n=1 Tax=Marssonina brunnea f. sp. multigermtubi (strain MB_m1) TaxID=1072389 RepID=K1XJM0_MARBU|nr:uncharacterized protein MBM_09163 [Drepanopeziza brunnea f. sp. 'multigermtubi' MB_m1]EKD12594.1 hypothetical protein MBM_09163 [Drepanopeziza brunnea f. sp. 'multigermtubi' MB_m1]